MKLLTSKIPPLSSGSTSFQEVFFDLLAEADSVTAATGYVSEDSLTELGKIIEDNRRPYLDVIMGMHYFEGITRKQYGASEYLHNNLQKYDVGGVSVIKSFKFHGKIYQFYKDSKPFACITGSSNLDNITDIHRSFETDILIDDNKILGEISSFLNRLKEKSSLPFQDWVNPRFISSNAILDNQDGVEKISDSIIKDIFSKAKPISFKIPLKSSDIAPKSNLNAFFGQGRKDKRGLIRPRPWYEVELIVPASTTREKGYPEKDRPFTVYTDDGWKFECTVNGAYCKNFRSSKDLTILGKWIKGRLEDRGALKIGNIITNKTFEIYGRNSIELVPTTNDNEWLLSFKEG